MNYELFDETILSYSKNMQGAPGFFEHAYHNNFEMLISAGTSWWWGAAVPTLTAIYNPDGTTFELFPSVLLTPPWTDKYSLMLQYIGIVSNDKFSAYAGGVFKGKSMFLFQFQYSFDLIRGRT